MNELKTIKEMMNMTILGEMIMQDGIEKGRREGIREGKRKGKDQINHLNTILIDAGRMEDLKRASRDKVFQDRLIKELLPEEYSSEYPKGIKVTDEEFASVNLFGNEFHPNWNYTICANKHTD